MMKEWMIAATADEQAKLAETAGTSREYLYQLANNARTASADLAGRIEDAAEELRKKSKGRLPRVTRADLCPACNSCPHARKCGITHEEQIA